MCQLRLVSSNSSTIQHSDLLSPRNVPAATMPKPIQSPYTIPHKSAMISWPKSGGKEMMNRITIGITQPAGRSRTFSENGRSFYIWHQYSIKRKGLVPNYMYYFVVLYGNQHGRDKNDYAQYMPGYFLCQKSNTWGNSLASSRIYFGDKKIFFQFIGLYSVSSGGPDFVSPLIPSISISVSRFRNHIELFYFKRHTRVFVVMLLRTSALKSKKEMGRGSVDTKYVCSGEIGIATLNRSR
jgi:hypothetical protein